MKARARRLETIVRPAALRHPASAPLVAEKVEGVAGNVVCAAPPERAVRADFGCRHPVGSCVRAAVPDQKKVAIRGGHGATDADALRGRAIGLVPQDVARPIDLEHLSNGAAPVATRAAGQQKAATLNGTRSRKRPPSEEDHSHHIAGRCRCGSTAHSRRRPSSSHRSRSAVGVASDPARGSRRQGSCRRQRRELLGAGDGVSPLEADHLAAAALAEAWQTAAGSPGLPQGKAPHPPRHQHEQGRQGLRDASPPPCAPWPGWLERFRAPVTSSPNLRYGLASRGRPRLQERQPSRVTPLRANLKRDRTGRGTSCPSRSIAKESPYGPFTTRGR